MRPIGESSLKSDRDQNESSRPRRRPWVRLQLLPQLTDLTLQSGSPIPGIGDTGGGGSTVF